MSKVWFTPLSDKEETNIICNKVMALYQAADFGKIFNANEYTAVKIHFGEKIIQAM